MGPEHGPYPGYVEKTSPSVRRVVIDCGAMHSVDLVLRTGLFDPGCKRVFQTRAVDRRARADMVSVGIAGSIRRHPLDSSARRSYLLPLPSGASDPHLYPLQIVWSGCRDRRQLLSHPIDVTGVVSPLQAMDWKGVGLGGSCHHSLQPCGAV